MNKKTYNKKPQKIIIEKPTLFRQIISSLVSLGLVFMNITPAFASNISGVTKEGNTFNIRGEKFSGSTQFRNYEHFELSDGDIANLEYRDQYDKFVNLVHNRVQIDGIVNTMKNNNFFDGHAVFVSPNGIVIGASGVLNVGSLTLATPGAETYAAMKRAYDNNNLDAYQVGKSGYNNVLTDSHGEVVINGKIIAKKDVAIYGDTITVKGVGKEDKAGIVAGAANQTILTTKDQAKQMFNTLVNNDIKDVKSFTRENGKIKIVAGFKGEETETTVEKAAVNIDNAEIVGKEVVVQANSVKNDYIFGLESEAISSEVNVSNSNITAENVDISATAVATLERNINLTLPSFWLWLFDEDIGDFSSSNFKEYFSDGVFNGFEGARSSAKVNIANSSLRAAQNLSVTTEALATTDISPSIPLKEGPGINLEAVVYIPYLFYGFGTKTQSQINITSKSALTAGGDINLNAFSSNSLKAAVADKAEKGFTLRLSTDAFDFAFMKNSAAANTKILIDNSNLSAQNILAQALAYNTMSSEVGLEAQLGDNDFKNNVKGKGGSAVVLAGILNATDIQSGIEIKNNSKLNAEKDVRLSAYNINTVSNKLETEIEGDDDDDEDGDDDVSDSGENTKKWTETVQEKLKAVADKLENMEEQWNKFTSLNAGQILEKLKEQSSGFSEKVSQEGDKGDVKLDKAAFQGGASALWSNTKTTNNILIENSTLTGENVDIRAHTFDAVTNEIKASVGGEASWGGALAFAVNNQTNNNTVGIKNATITAKKNIAVNSIVELPAQEANIGITNKWFSLGGQLGFGANGKFDWGWNASFFNEDSEDIIPKIGIDGFFNNFVTASGSGETGSLSAAIIYSDLYNNANINIKGSVLTAQAGDVVMNAVVSAAERDALDFFSSNDIISVYKDIVKGEPNIWNNKSGTAGLGGTVLIQNFTNNANISVDTSNIKAVQGAVELNTAVEQSYLNILTPGGKTEKAALTGAVSVQSIHGMTGTSISNSSVKADTFHVNTGKANVRFFKGDKSDDDSEQDKDGSDFWDSNKQASLADERAVEDHITSVSIAGSLTAQESDEDSFGAAVGATVIVQEIDRVVKTVISASNITARKVNLESSSYNNTVFITMAGAFAGGVETDMEKQKAANERADGDTNTGTDSNESNGNIKSGAQKMQNIGKWMDSYEEANDKKAPKLTDEKNANKQGSKLSEGKVTDSNMVEGAADPEEAAGNFSLAVAGSVSVVNDKSVVETEITGSTFNVGEELNVSAERENFMLNISGGAAAAENVGGGAAVNVYKDKGGASAGISDSNIQFTGSGNTKANVSAQSKHTITEVAVGVGIADGEDADVTVAVGGSFNTNILEDTTKAYLQKTNIQNVSDDKKNPAQLDVVVKAASENTIWNIGGDIGIANGGESGVGIGAGVAGNMDMLNQNVQAQITDSKLTKVRNVAVSAFLQQDINSISIAGAIVGKGSSSFTIDGALGLEFVENNVAALLQGTTISASGDVEVVAKSDLTGQTLTGATHFSKAENSAGVGIGAVVVTDNSSVSALIDSSKIQNQGSISVKADSSDNRQFLAVNLGISAGSGTGVSIVANGIVSVITTAVRAAILGQSELSSEGDVSVNALYANNNEGITIVGAITGNVGAAVGANIITNYYENDVSAEISKDAKITHAENINVAAKNYEFINLLPGAASVSTKGAAAAANVVVNIIKSKTNALVAGDLIANGHLDVRADSETILYLLSAIVDVAASGTGVAVGGAVNVDYIGKTVNAQIGDALKRSIIKAGSVSAKANAVTAMGKGKKDSSGAYVRDDITSDNYKDTLMASKKEDHSDMRMSATEDDFKEWGWNMFFGVSGGTVGVSGTVIVKTIANDVAAQILNADIESGDVNVMAQDYSVKNIVAGQVTVGTTAAVGAQVVVTTDKSNTKALISESNIQSDGNITVSAVNKKDNNLVVAAAGLSGTAAIEANVLVNTISDNNTAEIKNTTIQASSTHVEALEDINASYVVVGVNGGEVAVNVSPVVNTYNSKTTAQITNSTIEKSSINLDADTNIKTRTIGVGVTGAASGAAVTGLVLVNNYNTQTKALIKGGNIDTSKNIVLNANSVINSNNYMIGVAGVAVGAGAVINVIVNNIASAVESGILNATVKKAGHIALNTNKGKKDVLKNYGVSAAVASLGLAAVTNVIYNIYKNTVTAGIDNTEITQSDSIAINADSDRKIINYNIGAAAALEGAGAAVDALINEINTATTAFLNAKSKKVKTTGNLLVAASDTTAADNTLGTAGGSIIGAALVSNINLYYSDNLASAQILSNTDGQIVAGSATVSSTITNKLKNKNIGAAVGGAGAVAGDVTLVQIGKKSGYTDSEDKSNIDDAVSTVNKLYSDVADSAQLQTPAASSFKTGSIARINGNIKTTGNIDVNAKSTLGGLDGKLELTNVSSSGGLGAIGVGVKDVQLASTTLAEIAGGTVESTNGNISVNAQSTADVKITNHEISVAGLAVSGGAAIYNNSAETMAQINDATIKAKNVNVISNSTANSEIDSTNTVVSGVGIAVDFAENKDSNTSIARITGNTNIEADGELTLHATANTNLKSVKRTLSAAGVTLVRIIKNEVEVSTVVKALIEGVTGLFKLKGLNVITDYQTMIATAISDFATISGLSTGDVKGSGAKMSAQFTSGINSGELEIENKGKTTITTAKKTGSEGITAQSEIDNISMGFVDLYNESSAYAVNNARSDTLLKVKKHTANDLEINAYLDTLARAESGSVKASLMAGVSAVNAVAQNTSRLNVDIAGENTIANNAEINARHNAQARAGLSSLNFGGHNVSLVRISSELTADTTGNIGGTFNAKNAMIDFNTDRESVMSKSSYSAAVVNAGKSTATNKLTGASVLNINGLKTSSAIASNAWRINNTANNVFDVISSNKAGGFITASDNTLKMELNTKAETNVVDSKIDSTADVSFDVANITTVKDTSAMSSDGFAAIMDNVINNTYQSGVKLSLQNAQIKARDIHLGTLSEIKSAKAMEYVATGGGVGVDQQIQIKNNLIQTSAIELKKSKLTAAHNAELSAKTAAEFKQSISNNGKGFVSLPDARGEIYAKNTNTITLDKDSEVLAGQNAIFNLDSSNVLESKVYSLAKNFAGTPKAYSYVTLDVDNQFKTGGLIHADNLVDINFMNNSKNVLSMYAKAENHAAVASTAAEGNLKRNIQNNLIIDGEVSSNKNIEISFAIGSSSNKSEVIRDAHSYILFVPIHTTSTANPISFTTNNSLTLNGKMIAGQGNDKYMKINADGTIDKEATIGFEEGDYSLTGGVFDRDQLDQIKQNKLSVLDDKIKDAESSLQKVDGETAVLEEELGSYTAQEKALQAQIDAMNALLSEGYLSSNDLNGVIQEDFKAEILEKGILSAEQYAALVAAVEKALNNYLENDDLDATFDNPFTNASFLESFLSEQNFNGEEIAGKIDSLKKAYQSVYGNASSLEGGFVVYKGRDGKNYVAMSNVDGAVSDELGRLNDNMLLLQEQMKFYEEKIAVNSEVQSRLKSEIESLKTNRAAIEKMDSSVFAPSSDEDYAIVFKDMNAQNAHINIDGITAEDISGTGTIHFAEQGVRVDNHSNRSLVFNDINLGSRSQNGLFIGNENYSDYANSAEAIHDGVHYVTQEDGDFSGIIINNLYDNTHPSAASSKHSDVIFKGLIYFNGDFYVFNDSGSISAGLFNNQVEGDTTLIATKGDVNLNASGDLTFKENDSVIAGNAVNITADNVDIKGKIVAGVADLNLTITDDMLNNLKYDPVTGQYDLIDLGENNHIKAVYKDGQIYIFNINDNVAGVNTAERGKVSITAGSVNTDSATIVMNDGYQNISIDNQTDKTLNVGNITNTKSSGGLYVNGQKTKNATTVAVADTQISSDGKLVLGGKIKNSFDNTAADKNGVLNITAHNGLDILRQSYMDGDKLVDDNAILAAGKTNINVMDGATNIAGDITNTGDFTLTKNGAGDTAVSGAITNNAGTVDIINNGGKMDIVGSVINTGNITVTNNSTAGMKLSGDIRESDGDVSILNTKGDLTINSDILFSENANGLLTIKNAATAGQMNILVDIANAGAGKTVDGVRKSIIVENQADSGLNLAHNITAKQGNIEINNSNGALQVSGRVVNNKGDTLISNQSKGDLSFTGSVVNKGGNTIITNIGSAATIAGAINNVGGNVQITNNGTGTKISGNIDNEGGHIVVQNTNGDLTTTAESTIANNGAGNIKIANSGNGKMSLNGKIANNRVGNISINNMGEKGAEIAGVITNANGNTSIENENGLVYKATLNNKGGNTVITNIGSAATIAGAINNVGGNVQITNNGTGTKISGNIDNEGGHIVVQNTNGDLTTTAESTIDNNGAGNIKIANSGNGKMSLNGKIANNRAGNISITNTGAKGAEIAGVITNANGNTSIENENGLVYKATLNNKGGNMIITNIGSAATIAGAINNAGGNVQITNNGTGTKISGNIDNEGGHIVVQNTNGDLTTTAESMIENNGAGNIKIANSGNGKMSLNGKIANNRAGNISINNMGAKGAEIAGVITNANGKLAIENTNGALSAHGRIENKKGDITLLNSGSTADIAGTILAQAGNISVQNKNDGALTMSGHVTTANGNIEIANRDNGGVIITGDILAKKGKIIVDNTSKDGIQISTTGLINAQTGDIELSNTGNAGITVAGHVKADQQDIIITNKNSDIKIGEYASDNDNYINAVAGNVIIAQTGGNIINNISDPNTTAKHQNQDLGKQNKAYKTLIATGKDLIIHVTDGNIGSTAAENPGFGIEASTRDYTESINVKVGGEVEAIAVNKNKSDKRLVNLRAKDSDLTVKNITADGNILLTAADWKQADNMSPANDNAYYEGYSIFSAASGDDAAITGQNISVIASNTIGTAGKKLTYMQDTLRVPDSSVSFESENDLYLTGRSNSDKETKLYQLISKRGLIDLDLESNAIIKEITANSLNIIQKAQNLTIIDLGLLASSEKEGYAFEDMLYPHDHIVYGADDQPAKQSIIPNYVNIKVLDALDTADRSDSYLKIYTAFVAGNDHENAQYNPDGTKRANVSLMADNIYIASDKATDSKVSTKANPNGYKHTDPTYSEADFGGTDTTVYKAKGINAFGDGEALSFDVRGVSKEVVESIISDPQRRNYNEQRAVQNVPDAFKNAQDGITDKDYRAHNVVLSVNDYTDTNRGVAFNHLYADNAYINTRDTNLSVYDGYINNYAEFRNGNHQTDSNRYLAVIDNDYRRLVPSFVQLFTGKTGSFALNLNDTIKFYTTAPIVHYNWHHLVNAYSDENSFIRLSLKETELRQRAKQYFAMDDKGLLPEKPIAKYAVWQDHNLNSNVKIVEISHDSAVIVNSQNWQVGDKQELHISFNNAKASIRCEVLKIKGKLAIVKLLNMPAGFYNQIAYRYMKITQK